MQTWYEFGPLLTGDVNHLIKHLIDINIAYVGLFLARRADISPEEKIFWLPGLGIPLNSLFSPRRRPQIPLLHHYPPQADLRSELAAVTTANSSLVLRQSFRCTEIDQEVVQKGFHSAMGWSLGGDETG